MVMGVWAAAIGGLTARVTSTTTAEPRICRSDVIPPPGASVVGAARWSDDGARDAQTRNGAGRAGARGGEGKEGTWRGQSKVTNCVAWGVSGPNGAPGPAHHPAPEPPPPT